ncbi:superoxide dismutase [Cu-Zn] SodC [Nitrospirillum sp. BR 11163]|uniref:superoxide dismutase [Cu-Zn] SodC n=1 Tax=Nitrospirillum sp. BR 11163 TaxID=3104323 RepID=UPI002AFDF99A|nr:superoxide dismutase [Cu-Zn] SodC [Nitrospirillum sp. BR 11163]MEA1672605.1 superoxide dismutase [Cu-Zn] SodC [Nitrospirillum sp. BR 11163]
MTKSIPRAALLWGAMVIAAPGLALAATPVVTTVHLITATGVGAAIGTITATEGGDGLVLTPKLTGLPPGVHGFHLHANASCQPGEKDGKPGAGLGAGGHFDPASTGKHLGPTADGHKGDLPPLTVTADGSSSSEPLTAPHLKLADLAGHAFVIHAGGDNFSDTPEPLGGGGGRIACGVVGEK